MHYDVVLKVVGSKRRIGNIIELPLVLSAVTK